MAVGSCLLKTWQNNEGSWSEKSMGGGVASINLFPNANVASAWHLHVFLPHLLCLCLALLMLFSLFSCSIPRKSFFFFWSESKSSSCQLELSLKIPGIRDHFHAPINSSLNYCPFSRYPYPFNNFLCICLRNDYLGIYSSRRLTVHTNDTKGVALFLGQLHPPNSGC